MRWSTSALMVGVAFLSLAAFAGSAQAKNDGEPPERPARPEGGPQRGGAGDAHRSETAKEQAAEGHGAQPEETPHAPPPEPARQGPEPHAPAPEPPAAQDSAPPRSEARSGQADVPSLPPVMRGPEALPAPSIAPAAVGAPHEPPSTVHGDHASAGAAVLKLDPVSASVARQRAEENDAAKWLVYFVGASLTGANAFALARQRRSAGKVDPAKGAKGSVFRDHIEEPFATYLREFGIDSWNALRKADPAALAFWLGAERAQVDRWQAQADLHESLSLDEQLLRWLASCGVESIHRLADGDADELWHQLRATSEPAAGPGLQTVQEMVREAREQLARRQAPQSG